MIATKLHRLQSPGSSNSGKGAAAQGIHASEGVLPPPAIGERPHRQHANHVKATHQAIRRGRRRGGEARSMANGTKWVVTRAIEKPHTKYPPQSCHMGREPKLSAKTRPPAGLDVRVPLAPLPRAVPPRQGVSPSLPGHPAGGKTPGAPRALAAAAPARPRRDANPRTG